MPAVECGEAPLEARLEEEEGRPAACVSDQVWRQTPVERGYDVFVGCE